MTFGLERTKKILLSCGIFGTDILLMRILSRLGRKDTRKQVGIERRDGRFEEKLRRREFLFIVDEFGFGSIKRRKFGVGRLVRIEQVAFHWIERWRNLIETIG
jgi:hypothetical protein